MSLRIGIVGLPNVGKSTTFNALTKTQNAQVANYPFCTIEPNKAIVPVPDTRLTHLAELIGLDRAVPAVIEFVDVAGLVQGASHGEGLGNQFLGNIRDVDALLHVVRCFDDPNVIHISSRPDPQTDIEIINTELALADLQQLEKKLEKLERQARMDKSVRPILELGQDLKEFIGTGKPLWTYPEFDSVLFRKVKQEMRFLTAKPVIYAANVDEESLTVGNVYHQQAQMFAAKEGAELVTICARLEEELAALGAEDRQEYLDLAGLNASGLEKIVHQGYALLGLISYFSFNEDEVHAWTIQSGWTAPQAAGVIHTDFEKGFIQAEVIPYETFATYGSWKAAREAGQMQREGREYVVRDGDVIYFRFNV